MQPVLPDVPAGNARAAEGDMAAEIFDRLVEESGPSAEHMMLIGLGEPFLDPRIFERIEYCARHGISTLLSTNGTLLDEAMAERILSGPLESITLSFDGATKESFEFYRKGARFEKVRDNFVRFCRMKKERGARVEVVVQMVRMERNAGEVEEFTRSGGGAGRRPGPDQGGRDQPDAPPGGPRGRRLEVSLPLPVARADVREAERRRLSLLPELHAGRATGGSLASSQSIHEIWNSGEMQRMRRLHAEGRAGEIESVRVAAPRFRTRCWWWGAWPCTAARCGGCCRRLSGLLI